MCFGLQWFEQVLIWIVVVCAVVALLRLLITFILPKLGLGAEVLAFLVQAFTIVFWAVVCVAAIIFIFELISCLGPSMSLPRMR